MLLAHKDLFPIDLMDMLGFFLIGIGLMIAASGGVGGGGIVVPLLILVLGFEPKHAIPLSNFTILGSSITNMVLNFSKVHPEAARPLVDWDLILVMEPLTMAGAVLGALIGKILPDYILVIMLVVVLAYTTYTTLEKAMSQYEKETAAIANAQKSFLVQATEDDSEEKVSLVSAVVVADTSHEEDIKKSNAVGKIISGQDAKHIPVASTTKAAATNLTKNKALLPLRVVSFELEELLDQESETPMGKVALVSVLVVVVVCLNLFKSRAFGVECGSSTYWALTCVVFVWVLLVSAYVRNILIEKWALKRRLNYRYLPGDVEWNARNTVVYPCLCFFAGLCAGLFGIGGGIVKGPLMLAMGVHPSVASATCAVMIMFTSVAATTMYIAFGTMTWDYAWLLFVLGLVTTTIGQFGVSYLVDKYKRYSFISISIGSVVALSTVLMSVQSVFFLADPKGMPKATLCGKF